MKEGERGMNRRIPETERKCSQYPIGAGLELMRGAR